jgi:hypothetical protein
MSAMVMTSSSSENPARQIEPRIAWVEAERSLEDIMDILNIQKRLNSSRLIWKL